MKRAKRTKAQEPLPLDEVLRASDYLRGQWKFKPSHHYSKRDHDPCTQWEIPPFRLKRVKNGHGCESFRAHVVHPDGGAFCVREVDSSYSGDTGRTRHSYGVPGPWDEPLNQLLREMADAVAEAEAREEAEAEASKKAGRQKFEALFEDQP